MIWRSTGVQNVDGGSGAQLIEQITAFLM